LNSSSSTDTNSSFVADSGVRQMEYHIHPKLTEDMSTIINTTITTAVSYSTTSSADVKLALIINPLHITVEKD